MTLAAPSFDVRLRATWITGVGYRYDVLLGEEVIVSRSRDPSHDAARELLARGLSGTFRTMDFTTGKHRMTVDIEKAARLRTVERADRFPTIERYLPMSSETEGLLRPPTSAQGTRHSDRAAQMTTPTSGRVGDEG